MAARWTILTPTTAAGAVAGVLIVADSAHELDALGARLLGGAPPIGAVRLRRVLDVDDAVLARWSDRSIQIMPHAGAAVMRALLAALEAAGVASSMGEPASAMYPEARDRIEADMLAALARARSPLAIDLILRHAERCRRGEPPVSSEQSAQMRRLIDPALVVAVGAPNIGKSTLINALAGRQVSIVADEPGTTRDHVGAMLELDGVVVRYLDTPGIRAEEHAGGAPEVERLAIEQAMGVAAGADLLLLCGDPMQRAVLPPALSGALSGALGGGAGIASLRVCLRGDLLNGGSPSWEADAVVSAARGQGVAELARLVSLALVPRSARGAVGAWRFWE